MHHNAYAFVAKAIEATQAQGPVIDIGGRNINGSVRGLFGETSYISIDVLSGPGVDIIADGSTYRPLCKVNTVVCCEVLEHTFKAAKICRNAYRMLRAGGVFIVTTATEGRRPHSAIDGGSLRSGEFYRNISEGLLRRWLKPFARVEIAFNRETADIYAVAIKRAARRHSVVSR